MTKKNPTASEFLSELRNDPEWVRHHMERQARHKSTVERLQEEIRPEVTPLLAELAGVGYAVSSISELVNTPKGYPEAIPVLTKYLSIAQHPVLREGIARALTVHEARGIAGRKLLDELMSQKDSQGSQQRWALANALTVASDRSLIDEIRMLLADPRFEDVHERLNATLKDLRGRERY